MKSLLYKITQKKQELNSLGKLNSAVLKNIYDWLKIELTYSSNAIEGNTLTRQETSLIINKGITVEGKSIAEHLEAVNHAKAWDYILSLKDLIKTKEISEQVIREIHFKILENIDNANAGRYRSIAVRIAGSTVIMPNHLKVPKLMEEMISWVATRKDADIVETAILIHLKLVSIHPFADGNGRTARLLMNLIFLINGYPPLIVQKESRLKYILSIEKAQLKNDLLDYFTFMYEALINSFDIYIDLIIPKELDITNKSKKLLKIGELAKETNESVATIRFWTKEGLIKVKDYSKGNYQLFDIESIEKVKKIRELQKEKRLQISEIKKLLSV